MTCVGFYTLPVQILTFAALAIPCAPVRADDPPRPFTGKVVKIADGDTITVLLDKKQHRIRLEGIDSPEKGQAYGTKARQALADKIFGQTVRVEWKKRDRYNRIIGRVYLGDRDISLEMVKDGFAWHYKRYSKEAALADAEREARKAGRGLWADKEPTPPWEWRRERKAKK
jgi:endonuclease YncB( thermonuclease family)